MGTLNNNAVAITPQPEFDPNKLLEWLISAGTIITIFWKLVDSYYASKRRNNQEFIERVVKATMDSCLTDIKADIHEFKTEMKAEVTRFNVTVLDIYKEIRK